MSTVRGGEEHALTAQLSDSAKGTWEDKAAGRRDGLLDLIGHTAADGDMTQAMAATHAFLEAQLRQQHKWPRTTSRNRTKHKSRGYGMSL